MKKHITFGLFALCMAMGFAQRHEIGIKGGYSIVGGDAKSVIRSFPDAGTNRRVQPTYIGLFYKRNLNPRQAIRIDGAYNIAFFDNLYTGTTKMSNDILEASALFEYSFFSINDELKKLIITLFCSKSKNMPKIIFSNFKYFYRNIYY